jgi:putative intracellular protease/amidase
MNRQEFLEQAVLVAAAGTVLGGAMAQNKPYSVVIYLYEGMTALDAIGPYEVLRFLPNAQITFAAKTKGNIKTDSRVLQLYANASTEEVTSADVLLIPGGATTYSQMRDKAVVDWVKQIHATTRYTTSVCTGSLLLCTAGILKGVKATTHWASMMDLRGLGANAVGERVVREGKIITAAGVSAGLDMALELVALEAGEALSKAIQLAIEYDPKPPFDSGSFAKSSPETRTASRQLLTANARVAGS